MINEEVIKELGPPRSPLKQTHPLWGWFRELGLIGGLLAVVGGIAFALNALHVLGEGWAWGIFGVAFTLGLLDMVWTTAMTPLAWIRHRKRVRRVHDLIGQMTSTYRELQSDGPISASHLRECMRRAEETGVMWPSPLYALLDDIAARSGRL